MKRTIKTKPPLTPQQSKRKLTTDIVKNDTFFPNGVHIEDIDKAVLEDIKTNFRVASQGSQIPLVEFLSLQRWTEYTKTWLNTDDTNTVQLPFMAIVRGNTKKGTNLNGTYNIPANPTYKLWKRPVVKNGKQHVEFYEIPQPTCIDISYTLHLFTEHMTVCNRMDEMMLQTFKSSQYYVDVKGHYMPLKMEGIDDVSETELEKARYYHKKYPLAVYGYLLDEKLFRKKRTLDNIDLKIETPSESNPFECEVETSEVGCDFCLNFKFLRRSPNSRSITLPRGVNFTYDNQSQGEYQYFLDSSPVDIPFRGERGQKLTVAHSKTTNKVINIQICGQVD